LRTSCLRSIPEGNKEKIEAAVVFALAEKGPRSFCGRGGGRKGEKVPLSSHRRHRAGLITPTFPVREERGKGKGEKGSHLVVVGTMPIRKDDTEKKRIRERAFLKKIFYS